MQYNQSMTKKTIDQKRINEWASKRARPVIELAFETGCSMTLAKQIINGRYPTGKHPTYVHQKNIARVIGCEIDELFCQQYEAA